MFKKIMSLIICMIMMTQSCFAFYGDVNGDGLITASDALKTLVYSLNSDAEIDAAAADVDGSGKITANDALMILQKSLNLSLLFPVEEYDSTTESTTTEVTTESTTGGTTTEVTTESTTTEVTTTEGMTTESTTEVTTESTTESVTTEVTTATESTTEGTTEVTTESTTAAAVDGQLTVKDGTLYDSNGNIAVLKGYSTNGVWDTSYLNEHTLKMLQSSGANTIRVDMYASSYSYDTAKNVIDMASEKGMYTVINWHFDYDNPAPSYSQANALELFEKLSSQYSENPYVIYEICSAQGEVEWSDIAAYADVIIPAIKANNENALIVVGTPNWNQYVDEAEELDYGNIMYSIQISAGSHSLSDYKSRVETAKSKGLAVFATQIKVSDDSNSTSNLSEAKAWLDYFDENNISWCGFALESGSGKASALSSGADANSWTESDLNESGEFFFNRFKGITEITTTETESATEITTYEITDPDYNGVNKNGWLKLVGTQLSNEDGEAVQLRGMSTHGIAWYPDFTKEYSIQQTKKYGANLFRVAMYTSEYNGYCTGNADGAKQLLYDAVDTAIANDMYVIIDWHILSDNNPQTYKSEAKTFFAEASARYADYPNVLYEICNEPNGVSWTDDIKPYAEEIIPIIRNNAPNSIIIVGTNTWSQDVDVASQNPIEGYDNIMYTFHFYAYTHRLDSFKSKIETALNNGCAVFSTEWGSTDSSGNNNFDADETERWLAYFKEKGISWANWSLSNKDETSAALQTSADAYSWTYDDLSDSGKLTFSHFTD